MKLAFRYSLLTLSLLVSVKALADFETGLAAANAEDFETAYNKWKRLAEDGDGNVGYR